VNLNQLRVFREVAARGSFTAAAEALMLSQPAVSLHVRSLERDLGVRLLERGPGGVTLTEAGAAVLAGSTTILHTLDQMEQAVAEMRGARRGRVLLGANTTGGMYVAPRVVAAFREEQPEVEVAFQVDSSERLYERIQQSILDLAIVGGPADPARFDVRRLCADQLVLVAHPKHRLVARGPLRLAEVAREDLLLAEVSSRMRGLVEGVFREAGLAIRPRLVLSGTEALKKAAEASLGLAFVSAYAVEREVAAGALAVLPVADGTFQRDYELVSLKGRYLTPALTSFVEFALAFGDARLRLPTFATSGTAPRATLARPAPIRRSK
jgi:DNA-binding transcriptional LysR family regulator